MLSSMSRTLPMPFYSLVSGLKSDTLELPLNLMAAHQIPPLALGCRPRNVLPLPADIEELRRGVAGRDEIGVSSTLKAFAAANIWCALYLQPHC